MSDNAIGPVIAGLAVGLCLILVISIWSAFSPLDISDFAKRAKANAVVRSFLEIFPDAYTYVGNVSSGPTTRTVLYTVSMPWSAENEYKIPIYLRAVFTESAYPIIFHIHCQPGDNVGYSYKRVWDPQRVKLVFERYEECQRALSSLNGTSTSP